MMGAAEAHDAPVMAEVNAERQSRKPVDLQAAVRLELRNLSIVDDRGHTALCVTCRLRCVRARSWVSPGVSGNGQKELNRGAGSASAAWKTGRCAWSASLITPHAKK